MVKSEYMNGTDLTSLSYAGITNKRQHLFIKNDTGNSVTRQSNTIKREKKAE
jgi:hypothetical protein